MATRFDDIYSRLGMTEVAKTKEQSIIQKVDTKMGMLGRVPTADEMLQITLSRNTGRGGNMNDPFLRDIRDLSPIELTHRYGAETARNAVIAQGGVSSRAAQFTDTDRTWTQAIGDSVNSAVTEGVGGIAGLVDLGVQGITALAGGELDTVGSEAVNAFRTRSQDYKSQVARDRAAYGANIKALDDRDSQAKYDADIASGSNGFWAGLRKIGRDTLNSMDRLTDDPVNFAEGLSQAGGSLFSGSFLGAGARKSGKEAMEFAIQKGLVTRGSRASRFISKYGDKLAMPAIIAGQETAAVYQQTVVEVLDMTDAELRQNSPEYVALVEGGMSETDAQARIATNAGMLAAQVAAPVAALTGAMVGRFERNPLSAPNPIRNIATETAEEGIQGASGTVAQNYGIRTYADETRGLAQDVGENLGAGILFGSAIAGTVQTPNTIVSAGRLAAKKAQDAGGYIMARGRAIAEEAEAQAPNSIENVTAGAAQAVAESNELLQTTVAALDQSDAPVEAKNATGEYVQGIADALNVPQDYFEGLSPELEPILTNATNSIEMLNGIGTYLVENMEDASKENEVFQASIMLHDFSKRFQDIASKDPNVMDTLQSNPELADKIIEIQTLFNDIGSVKSIAQAIEKSVQKLEAIMNEQQRPVQQAELATPETRKRVQATVAVAEANPDKVNPDVVDSIIYHAEQGNIDLTPDQINALKVAASLVRTAQEFSQRAKDMGLDRVDIVSRNVLTDVGWKGFSQPSAREHARGIIDAVRRGDLAEAKERLEDLHLFAQHMQNKVAAFNEIVSSGDVSEQNRVHYNALMPSRKWQKSAAPLFINPNRLSSIQLAQTIGNEAQALAKLANDLSDVFPDLGVPHIKATSLDSSLIGSGQEVMTRFTVDNTQGQQEAPKQDTQDKAKKREPKTEKKKDEPKQEDTTQLELPLEQPVPKQDSVEPVEVEATPEPVTEPVRTGIDAVYPDLVGSEANGFKRAYSLPKEAKTRLAGVENPFNTLINAIHNQKAANTFVGGELGVALSADLISAYESTLQNMKSIVRIMNANLKAFLDSGKAGNTIRDGLMKGLPINEYVRGKALNIVDQTEDGFRYNPELVQTAVLAATQWLIGRNFYDTFTDREYLARYLGINESDLIKDTWEAFYGKLSLDSAVRSLKTKIDDYWGMNKNNNAPRGFTEGISEAVAKEVLRAMVQQGIVEQTNVFVDKDGMIFDTAGNGRKNHLLYDVARIGNKEIKQFPDLIEYMVKIDPEPTYYVGTAPTSVPTTGLNSQYGELTSSQRKALRKAQEINHGIDTNVLSFYENLGLSGLLYAFGSGADIESAVDYNVNHQASLKGQNQGIITAWEVLQDIQERSKKYAKDNKVELSEVPIFFPFNMTSVGRMQMIGRAVPQTNKLLREVLLPTQSTIDLTSKQDQDSYFVGIGQAVGVKVHYQSAAKTQKDVKKFFRRKAPKKALDHVRAWQKDGSKKPLTKQDIDIIKQGLGGEFSYVAVHALLDYARYLNTPRADRKAYQTSIYIEADGVTNGPINALMLMTAGRFDADWLKNMAKGGYFPGSETMSMNQHREASQDYDDLYQTVVNSIDMQNIAPEISAVLSFMSIFLPGQIKAEEDSFTITRNVVKNPITQMIYGAGTNAVARSIAKDIEAAIYERFSGAMQNPANSWDERLFGDYGKDSVEMTEQFVALLEQLTGSKNIDFTDLRKFTLTSAQRDSLAGNIELFVENLSQAILDVLGESHADVTRNLQRATNAQSIAFKHAFEREVLRMMGEKKAAQDKSLSNNELKAIYKKLEHISPLVQDKLQSYFIAKTRNLKTVDQENFSRSFDDKMPTPSNYYAPESAGVAGLAYLTQGAGDGLMMQNIFNDADNSNRGLPVFDGYNIPLDSHKDMSLTANKAVWGTWQNNIVGSVEQSFANFTQNYDLSNASDAELTEMMANFFDPKIAYAKRSKDQKINMLTHAINETQNSLNTFSTEISARQNVISQVVTSVDQMASSDAPFVIEGEYSDIGIDLHEKADSLNYLLDQELKATDPGKATVAFNLVEQGRQDESGVHVLNMSQFRQAARGMKLSQDHQTVLNDILNTMAAKGYTIVMGDPDQILAYAAGHGLTVPNESKIKSKGTKGYTNTSERIVYIQNPNPETMVHELIHAATLDRVFDHYFGITNDPVVGGAIERLEGLMEQFLNLELTEASASLVQAYSNAKRTIQGYLNKANTVDEQTSAANKARALNEFMAWGLSNHNLAQVQKQTTVNPLVRIAKDILAGIKRMLWGDKKSPKVMDDMFSNLRFNTAIVLRTDPSYATRFNEVLMYHDETFGESDRLTSLYEFFGKRIQASLNQADYDRAASAVMAKEDALAKAVNITNHIAANGFPMTMQEKTTFQTIVGAMMSEAELNPNSLARVQELYNHVMDNFSKSDAVQYNALVNLNNLEYDTTGRSSLLPTFLALSMVHDGFRDKLNAIELPKKGYAKNNSLDSILTNVGTKAMDSLSDRLAGYKNGKRPPNVQAALDTLVHNLKDSIEQRENYMVMAADRVHNVVDKANGIVAQNLNKLARKGVETLRTYRDNTDSETMKVIAGSMQVIVGALDEQSAKMNSEAFMAFMNTGEKWKPLHDFVNVIIGRTDSNKNIFDMIKHVRMYVEQFRQMFREHFPRIVNEQFSRDITEQEWTVLGKGFGKTDIVALAYDNTPEEILQMVQDTAVAKKRQADLEKEIKAAAGRNWAMIETKAKQLANFMTTGVAGDFLLRSGHAVATLAGMPQSRGWEPSEAMIHKVDQLITLYALNGLPEAEMSLISKLAQEEPEGVAFLFGNLNRVKLQEESKTQNNLNGYKGYMPAMNQEGYTLRIASDNERGQLELKGYKRVGDYNNSAYDTLVKRGYYVSTVSSRAAYNQGIMQNVRQTFNGTDPITGFSNGPITAGRITDPRRVRDITRRLANKKATDNLMPIFDGNGTVVAYERAIDPVYLAHLNQNNRLDEMLGVWQGRQAEEAKAHEVNRELVKHLRTMYDEDIKSNSDNRQQYVDLFDPASYNNDAIINDAVSLFTPDTRAMIQEVFGENFYVRRDMLNDTIGYRSASVGDLWTGNTRHKEETIKTARDFALGIFGKDAYRKLVKAEEVLQNLVAEAKYFIVVKSIIVPMANALSNVFHLAALGVPVHKIVPETTKKLDEINSYVKSRVRLIEAEAEANAATGIDPVKEKRLRAEAQAIRDSHKRLSIWPLIEKGEFSSISDVSISKEEIKLSEGKLSDYVEGLVDKLPESVRNAGRYAYITKDTALAKGLQRSVEYGDFIAKAILYDHLTKRKKLTKVEAIGRVTEEFIHYDRLDGRVGHFLEKNGLRWFWRYKMGAVKIAGSLLRNNPVHFLLSSTGMSMAPTSQLDLPTDMNVIAQVLDGSLDYSIGIEMGLNAPFSHPWVELAS